MTFNNKQELIDKIKEKQESAFNDLKRLVKEQKNTSFTEQAILKGNVEAYEDVIALIDSAKIVVYPEEIGKEPCEPAPKQDMKVKIIRSAYYSEFENDITDFIKDKNIIDIKFSVGSDYGMMNYCVMIIYKEDKSE